MNMIFTLNQKMQNKKQTYINTKEKMRYRGAEVFEIKELMEQRKRIEVMMSDGRDTRNDPDYYVV